MTQREVLPMFDVPTRVKIRKRVRDTSRAVYAEARESFVGRKAEVLRWLAHYWNQKQESPTSAELARFAPHAACECETSGPNFNGELTVLLYVRRGLSDLQTAGVVESAGKRLCRVTGKQCHTWRVVQR